MQQRQHEEQIHLPRIHQTYVKYYDKMYTVTYHFQLVCN